MDVFAAEGLAPFSILALIVVGLFLLELALLTLGISSQIGDTDVELGIEPGASLESLDGLGFDTDAIDVLDVEAPTVPDAPEGIVGALGLNKAPSLIWLAALMAFVSIGGFVLQGTVHTIFGGFLPSTLALAAVALPALFVTSRFARALGRMIPQVTTSAVSDRAFHRRRGRVSGGTAAAGRPAEIAWTDGYGNTHYLMAEPFDPKDVVAEGTEVLILRTRTGDARVLALS